MKNPKQRGFTLIELLVTLLVMGIVASIAIPNFRHQLASMESQRVTLALQELIRSNRIKAFTNHQRLVVCGSADRQNCSVSAWQNGWLVFIDQNDDRTHQQTEAVVDYIEPSIKYGQLNWNGFNRTNTILFSPSTGLLTGYNGSFWYCADDPQLSRKVIVSYMGHTRVEQDASKCSG